MRLVFPTREIPHKWAHQTQEHARNPQGNLYFRGPAIYSYRDSWPLARIYTRGKLADEHDPATALLVLTNSGRYRATTCRHQCAVNRAASHLPRIAVPYPLAGANPCDAGRHADNIAHLERTAAEHLAKAQRAMRLSNVEWCRREAFAALTDAGRYLGFFGIRRKAPQIPAAAWAAAEERARRIEAPDPRSQDKRERASAKRRARQTARLSVALDRYHLYVGAARTAWRLGDQLHLPAHPLAKGRDRWCYRSDAGPCMLRVHGEQIETSQGARIPLEHAPRLWRAIEAARLRGGYVHDGHAIYAGEYRIDRIDADGTLHAGCHIIPYSELRAMARTLRLV